MALAVNDFIQIVDSQTYLSQDVINVYWYRCTASVGAGADYLTLLLQQFANDVIQPLRVIQNPRFIHVSLAAKNYSNHIDIALVTVNQGGVRVSDPERDLPSWVQASFYLSRTSGAVQPGGKRIAGLCDEDVNGNNWASPITPLVAIEAALIAPIQPIPTVNYVPVIVRVPTGPLPVITAFSTIPSAQFRRISTQRSRLP